MKITFPEEHALSALEHYMIGHEITVKVDDNNWKPSRDSVAESIGYLIADLYILAELMGTETTTTAKYKLEETKVVESLALEHEADVLERKERVKLTLSALFA